MMRFFLASLCMLLLTQTAFGQDFQGIRWGTPVEDVPAIHGDDVMQHADPNGQFDVIYTYHGTADNQEAAIRIYVVDGKVAQGKYLFVGPYFNYNEYIEAYEANKQMLTRRYGAPASDVVDWKDEQFRGTRASWGEAVHLGHVTFRTEWITPSLTVVDLSLTSDEGFVIHAAKYASPGVADGTVWQQRMAPGTVSASTATQEDWDFTSNPIKLNGHTSWDHGPEGAYPLHHHSTEELNRELDNIEKAEETYCANTGRSPCRSIWSLQTDVTLALKWREGRAVDHAQVARDHPEVGWLSGFWCKDGQNEYSRYIEVLDDQEVKLWYKEGNRITYQVEQKDPDTYDLSYWSLGYKVIFKRLRRRGDDQVADVFTVETTGLGDMNNAWDRIQKAKKMYPDRHLSDQEALITYYTETLTPESYTKNPWVYSRCDYEAFIGQP